LPPPFWNGCLIGLLVALLAWVIMFTAIWPHL